MANEYFTPSGYPATGAAGSSANMRSELVAVQTAFDKLPALATNANKVVVVNPSATGQTVAPVTVSATGAVAGVSTLATSGNTTVGGTLGVTGATTLAAVSATDLTTTGNTVLGNASTDTLNVGAGDFIKDAAGNVGVGAAPRPWGATYRSTDVRTTSFYDIQGTESGMAFNAYNDGANWKYNGVGGNATALRYYQTGGFHAWEGAVSGVGGTAIAFVERMRITPVGIVQPGADNTQTLGAPTFRWSTVYAGTAAINTSDAREKTPVRALTVDEIAAARDLSREVGAYQFLSAVAAKGSDGAREHIGMTVQRAIEVMQSHGLDPMRYGFICHDTWDATATAPAGDRYGFRVDELNLFLARGLEARITALEARA